ncbi:MAG: polysaccharide biosynthesis/export family protein [Vicinamibacteria bacterium]
MKVLPLLSFLLLVVSTRAESAGWKQEPPREQTEQAAPAPRPALPDWSMDYAIQPGDVIGVVVWKEPELTSDHTVRLDGHVTMPLLGDIKASGRLPSDLARDIGDALKIYIERPIVTVGMVTANNARFFVIGEVMGSGSFPMFGRTTVAQGLALAGGFQEFAKKSRIQILRFVGDQQVAIPVNFDEVENGLKLEQNIVLLPGDTIIVP